MLQRIRDGRTDLVFDYVAQGHAATSADEHGTRLIEWCAYHGDVSALRFLLANGESVASLGENMDLNGAVFHGHWQLCQFLVEHAADVNHPLPDTGETPLHAALCKANRPVYDQVIEILLAAGANPNSATRPGVETGGFMRDVRTKGETPLHRAAAFGTEKAIDLLLGAGADREAKDMNGDTPLGWGELASASGIDSPEALLRTVLDPSRQQVHVRPRRGLVVVSEDPRWMDHVASRLNNSRSIKGATSSSRPNE